MRQLAPSKEDDEMEECLFVHPENIQSFRRKVRLEVAVIARPDWFMQANSCRHVIVETDQSVHLRCYICEHENVPFLIVYGRFGRKRTTAKDIDFVQTQQALSFLGIKTVVGTFVAGSIQPDGHVGEIYVPHDYVGLGGFNQSIRLQGSFRNVDMAEPFCPIARNILADKAKVMPFSVKASGVYACFHGYPRIETKAELFYYAQNGWDIVGQTLDPEATLAREAGCHYAALAGTIDDLAIRVRFANCDPMARTEIDAAIPAVRRKTFELFLAALPELMSVGNDKCNCVYQGNMVTKTNVNFYYRPRHLFEE